MRRLLLAALLLAGAALPLRAEEARRLVVPTLPEARITLDGRLDEPAWQRAALIDGLTQHEPDPGAPTEFATQIRIFTDGENLFLGYRCVDPEPGRIAVHTLQRDGDMSGDDSVDFVLDTFGDGRTAYWFLVNAGGGRMDGLVSASGASPSLDWDGAWSAVARRTPEGWSAEVEIPARTLHFRRDAPVWGFNIARQVARRQMILRWTGIPHDAGFWDLRRAGRIEGLAGMRQGKGVALAPFALGQDSRDRPAAAHATGRSGFDLSYSPAPALTGVFTYRTDFAETEVDTRQVNLTRFPLFFPEKRAFFVEGANQFEFAYGLGTDFIPFFTRRIGLFADQEVPIGEGFKALGHSGPWEIGALGVRTRTAFGDPPATTLGAGRVTYDVDPHWRLGTLWTSGNPDGVSANTLGAVDAFFRTSTFRGDKNLVASFWGARSSGDLPAGLTSADPQRGGWGAILEYPNDRWELYADVRELGDALDPALGFLPRPGTRWYKLGTAFQPRPAPAGPFGWARQFFFENYDYLITDLQGETESWRVFLAPFNVVTRHGDHFELDVEPHFERLDGPFALSDKVAVPAGRYPFTRYDLQAEAATSRDLRPTLTVTWGEFYDGHLTQWIPTLTWSAVQGHLRLDATAELDDATLREGTVVERLWGVRVLYALSPDLVVSSFTQYDSTSRSLGSNNLLRWTIAPGRDLFLVLNRGWDRRFTGTLVPQQDQVAAKLRWTLWW